MMFKKVMAIATLTCVLATGFSMASAEESTAAAQPAGTTQQQQQPAAQASNKQQGQRPNGKAPNGQQGQQPNGQAPNGQQRQQPNGKQDKQCGGRIDLKTLLDNGVIDQTTYDTITAYLKEHTLEKPAQENVSDTTMPPEAPAQNGTTDGAAAPEQPAQDSSKDTATPPEKPADAADSSAPADQNNMTPPGNAPDMSDSVDTSMLDAMLKANVITQAQYDAITQALTTATDISAT